MVTSCCTQVCGDKGRMGASVEAAITGGTSPSGRVDIKDSNILMTLSSSYFCEK